MNFAGLDLSRPRLMGIVNVTPDSFADAGETFDHADAIERGLQHIKDGADLIDVGGESTRPGATPVSVEEECRRILPVIDALVSENILVSVDTRHADVMKAALGAGAKIINDVSALSHNPRSLDVAATNGANVVLMHTQGAPDAIVGHTVYHDVMSEVRDYLQDRVRACQEAGIGTERLCVDPGIGFAKTPSQNFELLDRLQELTVLQLPILVGVSRKFGLDKPPTERLDYSVSLAIRAIENGARLVRVHDLAATRSALDTWLCQRNEVK